MESESSEEKTENDLDEKEENRGSLSSSLSSSLLNQSSSFDDPIKGKIENPSSFFPFLKWVFFFFLLLGLVFSLSL